MNEPELKESKDMLDILNRVTASRMKTPLTPLPVHTDKWHPSHDEAHYAWYPTTNQRVPWLGEIIICVNLRTWHCEIIQVNREIFNNWEARIASRFDYCASYKPPYVGDESEAPIARVAPGEPSSHERPPCAQCGKQVDRFDAFECAILSRDHKQVHGRDSDGETVLCRGCFLGRPETK